MRNLIFQTFILRCNLVFSINKKFWVLITNRTRSRTIDSWFLNLGFHSPGVPFLTAHSKLCMNLEEMVLENTQKYISSLKVLVTEMLSPDGSQVVSLYNLINYYSVIQNLKRLHLKLLFDSDLPGLQVNLMKLPSKHYITLRRETTGENDFTKTPEKLDEFSRSSIRAIIRCKTS